MRRWLTLLAAPLVLLGLVSSAHAFTCNASGCTWNSAYTEPSLLTNNQPITDLTGCTMTYTIAVDGGAPGAPKSFTIPATRPAGGGVISKDNTDPTMLPSHAYRISQTAVCTSTTFGAGAASAAATLTMNNGLGVPAVTLTIR